MTFHKMVGTVFATLLMAGLLPARPLAHDDIFARSPAAIDTGLLAALAQGAASFFVEMETQAGASTDLDLSPAYEIEDWDARGWYVYNMLRASAGRTQAPVIEYATKQGLEYRSFFAVNSVYIEQGTLDQAVAIAGLPGVARLYADAEIPLKPSSPSAGIEDRTDAYGWNLSTLDPAIGLYGMQAAQVWDTYDVKGAGMVVANIDTGVDYLHPALVRQYRGNLGGGTFDHNYNWYQPTVAGCGDGTYPCDWQNQGSGTMGIMVGETADLAEQIGVAPEAQWIACMGCTGPGCTGFDLIACMEWMLAPTDLSGNNADPSMRPHIVNNAWGGSGCDTTFHLYLQAWLAAGIFPAFSTGGVAACAAIGSPGDNPEVFNTAAHDTSGTNLYAGGPSCFFCNPSCDPDAHQVDPHLNSPTFGRTANRLGGYSNLGGSAGAIPHAAGTVALVWSANPSYIGQIYDTFGILEQSANKDVPAGNCGEPACAVDHVPNYEYGWGYLDAYAAVTMAGAGESGWIEGMVTADRGPVNPGGGPLEAEILIQSTGGMTWTVTSDPDTGYYYRWLVEGWYDVTASAAGYLPEMATLQITNFVTTTHDFSLLLDQPDIVVTPPSMEEVLIFGETSVQTMTISNEGPAALEFEISEIDRGMVPQAEYLSAHIPPFTGELRDDGVAVSFGPAPQAAPSTPSDGVETAEPGGVVINANPAFGVNLGNNSLYNIPDLDTPGTWNLIGAIGIGSAYCGDFAFGDLDTLYIINSDDQGLYAVDTATGASTLIGLCPSGKTWTGLSFDPTTGLMYGSATDGVTATLYAIDLAAGSLIPIGPITGFPYTIDIAVDADGNLYGVDISTDEFIAIDKDTAAATAVGSLGFAANYAQGLDFDDDAGIMYWAAYGASGELRIIDITTGASAHVGAFPGGAQVDSFAVAVGCCGGEVPWLSEMPVSGTVPAYSSFDVAVAFDSGVVPIPGEYWANLRVASNDPYEGSVMVPVTMTVLPTGDIGRLEGTTIGTGYCDAGSYPVEADVLIESSAGMTWTTTADLNGFYYRWLEAGTYTVTATAVDHVPATDVAVVQVGMTTTLDLMLHYIESCMNVTPASFSLTLPVDSMFTGTLSILNNGAGELMWEIHETTATMATAQDLTIIDVPWVSEVPTAGVTLPYSASDIDVVLETHGLTGGECYTASLSILHDDPGMPDPHRVPLELCTADIIPDFALSKAATPDIVQPGDEITFTLSVGNNGDAAHGVTIRDLLPAGIEFVSASDEGRYDPGVHDVTWTRDLAAGEKMTYTLTTLVSSAVDSGTWLTNVVSLDWSGIHMTATATCTVQPDVLYFYLPLIYKP